MNIEVKKVSLFGIHYSIVDYESATRVIIKKASQRSSFAVSALAVHGLVTSIKREEIGDLVKKIDLIVPDGQPIRWAINNIHKLNLKDRVYGPTLILNVLKEASKQELSVYLYGSTEKTLRNLSQFINSKYPGVNICGIHVDRFRDATITEDEEDIRRINDSGANIVFVGRGCPRQEVWVAEHLGRINAVMMAVGAAFDFLAGSVRQAPNWMQNSGLEWFYRLMQEPRRLWKRYLFTNSYFIFLILKYKLFTK